MNVLIVDDSMVIRKMLKRVLSECALGVVGTHEAGDGKQGLAVLQEQQVDLVLCDVNMPVMDGHQFLASFRANVEWAKIPVLMVTTEGSSESVMRALQLGANGYIRKPFTPEEVKQKTLEAIKRLAEAA